MAPMVAMSPRTSPALATLKIKVFPAPELMDNFTSPVHSTNTPRASCFSRNNNAPAGYVADDFIALKSFTTGAVSWQKKPPTLNLQDWQFSFASNPYGPRILGSLVSAQDLGCMASLAK